MTTMSFNDFAAARLLHVLAIVLWIGGVAMVTTVILPAARRGPADRGIALFEAVERRFARQARLTTLLAGVSGFYLTYRLQAWDRFLEPTYWWMHAMVLVWGIFTLMLFVLEPLVLHRHFQRRAEADPQGILRIMQRAHWALLALSLIAAAGAVAGSHGGILDF